MRTFGCVPFMRRRPLLGLAALVFVLVAILALASGPEPVRRTLRTTRCR